jgi:hypothetical protein
VRLLAAALLLTAVVDSGCSLFSPLVACDEATPCPGTGACGADGFCGEPDPGEPDAGEPDAGEPDAGAPTGDAGFDAGAIVDAGADGGAPDAGGDAGLDAGPPPPLWHDTWRKRKAVTIANPGSSGSLTRFPVWLHVVADAELRHVGSGGDVESAAGFDIRFGNDSGNDIYRHELVDYDPATGDLDVFVRVPSVALGAETTFFLYFGAPSLTSPPPQPEETWSEDYTAVWHLDEDPAGGATLADSANDLPNADGTAVNLEAGDQVPGQVGGSLALDGTDERVSIDSAVLDEPGAFTLEAWARMEGSNLKKQRIFQRGVSGNERVVELFVEDGGGNEGKITFRVNLGLETGLPDDVTHHPGNQGGSFALNQWIHYVATFLPGSQNTQTPGESELRLWVNGSTVTMNVDITNDRDLDTGAVEHRQAVIGNGGANPAEHGWDGRIDEVRISSTVRSADWIQLSYSNQLDPGAFASVGGGQPAP